ncbi:hypothetical protein OHA72_47985 [Dactylosporangium sp. NBC_01737]|uniref:hypothetical protein n=1 Tax=Dactylosporangium sp. NBC_01737 TaxID=2975959 RepID=UPI002E10F68F|nr:hypothetical protein OHA72_47985 [Dactylosporangium sp. NBC_01737]
MVDFALVALIAVIAAYAGGVAAIVRLRPAGPARALFEGAVAAAGVAASFALMLVLARVWLPGTIIVAALLAGGVLYGTLRRDLGPARAGGLAAGGGLLIGASFLFVSYLAVMALIGAAGVYLALRLRLRTRPALLVMAGALGTLLATSAGVFALALSSM